MSARSVRFLSRWPGALSVLVLLLLIVTTSAAAQSSRVPEIPLDGPVGPATADFVVEAIENAAASDAPLVILRIDTPGGLSASMREIVQAILASPVPIVGYVAPSGARAASAGTYILYATHVAAMAPATTLGAATPINIGGGSSAPRPGDQGGDKQGDNENEPSADKKATDNRPDAAAPDFDNEQTKRRKQVNDAIAYIRSLAEQHRRNADWAEKAVRDAATLTASEALEQNVINLVAENETALLSALDGREIAISGQTIPLDLANAQIQEIEPGLKTRVLATITNPSVAYLLFVIGLVGLAAEALNPGAALPGVLGAISLIVAFYAFNMMPIDITGAMLIALGVMLIVAEAFVPSFGALGLGGVVALGFGSFMLTDTPGYELSVTVIAVVLIAALALLAIAIWQFKRARNTRIETGVQGLIGRSCIARFDFEREGRVWLHGESWRAETSEPVIEGQHLIVTDYSGLTVHVRPLEHQASTTRKSAC